MFFFPLGRNSYIHFGLGFQGIYSKDLLWMMQVVASFSITLSLIECRKKVFKGAPSKHFVDMASLL
ncbi:hypothetical protein PEDI_49950 [Persicobacter diffluens]|uniref:Uncharacterized protein n=1 Tax=Persicobacter diffluens TaxID=981 RepID=A0AAN4W4E5_9BACT|nr:hypothetical protein PEDI_49950 [Persicobacter diffluens]